MADQTIATREHVTDVAAAFIDRMIITHIDRGIVQCVQCDQIGQTATTIAHQNDRFGDPCFVGRFQKADTGLQDPIVMVKGLRRELGNILRGIAEREPMAHIAQKFRMVANAFDEPVN